MKDEVDTIQKGSRRTNVKRNKRIKCLSSSDCSKGRERCCYTFLDPRSRCFKKCPRRWHERIVKNKSATKDGDKRASSTMDPCFHSAEQMAQNKSVENITNSTTSPVLPSGMVHVCKLLYLYSFCYTKIKYY